MKFIRTRSCPQQAIFSALGQLWLRANYWRVLLRSTEAHGKLDVLLLRSRLAGPNNDVYAVFARSLRRLRPASALLCR